MDSCKTILLLLFSWMHLLRSLVTYKDDYSSFSLDEGLKLEILK